MCFSYSVNFNADSLKSQFTLADLPGFNGDFVVSAFSYPELPVVLKNGDENRVELMHWGLIPSWTKNEEEAAELRKMSLNARGETLNEKPMFKRSMKQRCLIPASGFFEWRTVGDKKYPYFIFPEKGLFYFGGIYSNWLNPNTGEEIQSFSMVTTAANPMMEFIHNLKKRMPLILPDENLDSWLDENFSDTNALIKPYDEALMRSHTVGPLINSRTEDRNDWKVQQQHKYPELEQKSLF